MKKIEKNKDRQILDELMELVLNPVSSIEEKKERDNQIDSKIKEIGGKEGFYRYLFSEKNIEESHTKYLLLTIIFICGLLGMYFYFL